VPPRWPSRAKVLFSSFIVAGIGMALYRFMLNIDVGFLALQTPVREKVECLSQWPERSKLSSWWNPDGWTEWYQYHSHPHLFISQHTCPPQYHMNSTSCMKMDMHISDLQRKLALPAVNYKRTDNLMEIYGHFFLYLSLCLWINVVFHDLALLSLRRHDSILDLYGIRATFPSFFRLWKLNGLWSLRRLCRGKSPFGGDSFLPKGSRRLLAICMSPLFIVWFLIWLTVIMPVVIGATFLRNPIRLSRAGTFINAVLFGLYGILLMSQALFALGSAERWRPVYAVTVIVSSGACTCGCDYPITDGACIQIFFMGLIISIQGLLLATRCLKGLRRSNWANLMTVMYTIPLTVFDVEWTQPDGEPITFRKPGEPVQGEPAFDPFALMDEQEESAFTTIQLEPVPIKKLGSCHKLSGPVTPGLNSTTPHFIGCCGFPCPRKIEVQADLSETDDEATPQVKKEEGDEERLEQPVPNSKEIPSLCAADEDQPKDISKPAEVEAASESKMSGEAQNQTQQPQDARDSNVSGELRIKAGNLHANPAEVCKDSGQPISTSTATYSSKEANVTQL